MPIYEYKCENGHVFETVQPITDEPLTECEQCGAPCQRVLHPVAVHFKGKGFYSTDYGKKTKAGVGAKEESGNSKDESKSESKSDTGSSGSGEKSSSKSD